MRTIVQRFQGSASFGRGIARFKRQRDRGFKPPSGKARVEKALKSYGMEEDDIEKAAALAMKNRYNNPMEVNQEKARELIRRAWAGESAKIGL